MQEKQEMWVWSLSWEDPLEKEVATFSSILAWEISWTEEPGRLQSIGSWRIGHDWSDLAQKGGRSRPDPAFRSCVCVCRAMLEGDRAPFSLSLHLPSTPEHVELRLSPVILESSYSQKMLPCFCVPSPPHFEFWKWLTLKEYSYRIFQDKTHFHTSSLTQIRFSPAFIVMAPCLPAPIKPQVSLFSYDTFLTSEHSSFCNSLIYGPVHFVFHTLLLFPFYSLYWIL